jgi:hypothetical protein
MPSIVSNSDTENALRNFLESDKFSLSPPKNYGQTGVDIFATRGEDQYHIEVIGYKSSGPARAKDFYESFFRAISRIKDGAVHCVIAMPKRAERGLPVRARRYGIAWERIGEAFPELEIWLVDADGRSYERTSWTRWLNA